MRSFNSTASEFHDVGPDTPKHRGPMQGISVRATARFPSTCAVRPIADAGSHHRLVKSYWQGRAWPMLHLGDCSNGRL